MQVTCKLDGESDYQIDSPSARIKWIARIHARWFCITANANNGPFVVQNTADAPGDHLGLKGVGWLKGEDNEEGWASLLTPL